MTSSQSTGTSTSRPIPPFAEFITLMALTMGMVALSIDNLLPAFGPISQDFALSDPNEIQLLVFIFMIGFSLMQIVYGPLADVYGRKITLMLGLFIYTIGTLLSFFADSFDHLLIARFIQGLGAAAPRILTLTIIRDCFEGRDMARVMSLVMMVFIIVPVFAPASGGLILSFGSWHLIFGFMLLLVLILVVWYKLRMPETLHPEYRHKLSIRRILRDFRVTATTRQTLGYGTAMGLCFGCLMSYIGSAEQIFDSSIYKLGDWFPVVFGLVAAAMSVASFVNARLVRKIGMHKLSHFGLCVFIAMGAVNLAIALAFDGVPPLWMFGVGLTIAHFAFMLTMPNFNSLAMEPLGAIAGTASSLLGFYTTLIGVMCGTIVGQNFNGTVIPIVTGYLTLGGLCLIIVLITEKGRLFRPTH
ncbi:major facilitator transporter [Thalassospira profundimaris]|uniref:Bcr/CflA family efflux transporter n=1 Tax=Thalassospira profundimaris TaxID=502049 RepID=A0A367X898_9PROT|nr:multidrug effflux MFS transporter [Thalassospira profundimaris]RCK49885.1 major facilitator transporter [Thalassospira profundimaris]